MTKGDQRRYLTAQYEAGEIDYATYSERLHQVNTADLAQPSKEQQRAQAQARLAAMRAVAPARPPAALEQQRAPLDPQSAALLRAEVDKLMHKTAAPATSDAEDLEPVRAKARAWALRRDRR